jgi:hypothetical protein
MEPLLAEYFCDFDEVKLQDRETVHAIMRRIVDINGM